MARTIIITDSNCDLPANLINDNIRVIPLEVVTHNDERYSADVVNKARFNQLLNIDVSINLCPPSRSKVEDIFNSIPDDVIDVIILLSSSSVYFETRDIIKDVAEFYQAKHIYSRIHLINSKKTSMALGLLVLDCAKLIDDGMLADGIISYIKNNRDRYMMTVAVEDYRALFKNKVVNKRQMLIAEKLKRDFLINLSACGLFKPKKTVSRSIGAVNYLKNEFKEYKKITDSLALVTQADINEDSVINFRKDFIGEDTTDVITTDMSIGNSLCLGPSSIAVCYKK